MRIKKTDIRKAEFSDASMLNFLIRQCFLDVARSFGLTPENFPEHPSNTTVEMVQKDLSKGLSFYIKIDRGIPSGCIGLEKVSEDLWDVVRLGVLPGRRKRGFGKELLEKALLEARELGAKRVSATIIAEDTELKQWYEKSGFVETETRNFKYHPYQLIVLEYSAQPL
ncbi:MAG: GNAT family N-acetyltransferase [Desulfobacterales bacterium]|jgi:N-acetylglutamate synthase-like GNAT family acetyltransferase|nr:GNAT family N-acetyltransferase [Desulfobacterales bacterium]